MPHLPTTSVRNLDDLARLEAEMTLDERLPERSVLDVFIAAAARHPDRTALIRSPLVGVHQRREHLELVPRGRARLSLVPGGARPP
jgi:hypothetical protein